MVRRNLNDLQAFLTVAREASFIAVDHVDDLAPDDQITLFSFYNSLKESGEGRLLMAGRKPPMAAAVGTPVVALFSSQNATIWRPLGAGHTVLQTELPCACLGAEAPSPCVKGDSYQSWCVRKLTADQVFDAVQTTVQSDGHGD